MQIKISTPAAESRFHKNSLQGAGILCMTMMEGIASKSAKGAVLDQQRITAGDVPADCNLSSVKKCTRVPDKVAPVLLQEAKSHRSGGSIGRETHI